MRKRKCMYCEKLYPTKVEDDYTGECSECSDLDILTKLKIQRKKRGY